MDLFMSIIDNKLNEKPKWIEILKSDPRKDLINCDEPFTIYKTLTNLLGIDKNSEEAKKQKELIKKDKRIIELVNRIPDWEKYPVTGHNKSDFSPSLINLLFDMGIEKGDINKIDLELEKMLLHQDTNGRFNSFCENFNKKTKDKDNFWSNTLCDSHIIILTLIRGGYIKNPKVKKGILKIIDDYKETSMGKAWKCEPDSITKWRGPGKKDDPCPMVTLEALKVFSYLSQKDRPDDLYMALNTMLYLWKRRKDSTPYMMGHGRNFRKFKTPIFWYNIGWFMDTLSRYPEIHEEKEYIELTAILAGINTNEEGKVVLKSTYRDFKNFSFGQKKEWSPFQTYYLCNILKKSEKIIDKAKKIDISYYLENQ